MPECRNCGKDLKPVSEHTSVIGFPIKAWYCECGFKRWATNRAEYDEWDYLYGKELNKEEEDSKYIFHSLNKKSKGLGEPGHIKHGDKCGCDEDCDDRGGGCSSGGCGGCKH